MSNRGHHDPFRRPVATQLVSNDHAWSAPRCTPQLAEEPDGSKAIALWLHENSKDNTVLIDRSPKVVGDSVDLEEDFIQMPFVTRSERDVSADRRHTVCQTCRTSAGPFHN